MDFDINWQTAIAAPVTLAAGALLKTASDIYFRNRRIRHEEEAADRKIEHEEEIVDNDRADTAYAFIVGKFEQRIQHLESELITVRGLYDQAVRAAADERIKCVQEQGELKSEIRSLQRQMDDQRHYNTPAWVNTSPVQVDMHIGDSVLSVAPGHAVIPTSDGPTVITPAKFVEWKLNR